MTELAARPIPDRRRRLSRDASGTALIEFALVLPFMLTLYLGGFQLMDAIACNRKVTVTTRAVADLISQSSVVSSAEIDQILNASAQIMYPFRTSSAVIRVSEITTDASGNSKVVWSRAINASGYTAGTNFSVPSTIRSTNNALIYAEVRYSYTAPVVSFGLLGPRTLSQTIYMVPRTTPTVDCTNCVAT